MSGEEPEREPVGEEKLQELFFRIVELEPGEHAAFLDRHCAGEPAMRRQLEAMIADAGTASGHLLDTPAVEGFGVEIDTRMMETFADDDLPLPEEIGHYEILGVLGEGGMGIVFEARQQSPRRSVALKVIRSGITSSSLRERFRREAEILGRLSHPGIAQIFEAGTTDDGQPFFAMEKIDGETLTAHAQDNELDLRARIELMIGVCDAVHHAHEQQIIHRDLKPRNVLVDPSGQPKVLDFGVARTMMGADNPYGGSMTTETGQIIGTMTYMSPEQFAGRTKDIDRRTDVYALGVILYELLAGKLPYDITGCSISEASRRITELDPARLGRVDPRLKGDLETIVMKALAKERERRYATAADLGTDLRAFLDDQPITARAAGPIYRIGKFVRRHRASTGNALAAVVLAVVAWIALDTSADREAAARLRSVEQGRRARASRLESLAAYRSVLATAVILAERDPGEARRLLDGVAPPLRGWEWEHHRRRVEHVGSFKTRANGTEYAAQTLLHLDSEGWARLTPRVTRRKVPYYAGNQETRVPASRPIDPQGEITAGPDGKTLGVHLPDTWTLQVWDPDTGELRSETAVAEMNAPAVPWGRASADRPGGWEVREAEGFILLTNPVTGAYKRLVNEWAYRISPRHVVFCDTGRGTGFEFWGVKELWNLRTNRLIGSLPPAPHRACRWGALSADFGRIVAYGNALPQIYLAPRPGSGAAAWVRVDIGSGTRFAHFDPTGRMVATANVDGVLRLFDAVDGRQIGAFGRPGPQLYRVRFSPDGSLVAAVAWDGTVRIWDVALSGMTDVLRGHGSPVVSVAFDPTGARVVSGGADGTLRFWDAAGGDAIAELRVGTPAGSGPVRILGFEAGGRRLLAGTAGSATAEASGLIALDLLTGARETRAAPPPSAETGAGAENGLPPIQARSPDGRRIATGADGPEIEILDAETGEPVATLTGHRAAVLALAWSPDGRRLVSGSADHDVRIWETGSLRERVRARNERQRLLPELEHKITRLLEEHGTPEKVLESLEDPQRELANQILLNQALTR